MAKLLKGADVAAAITEDLVARCDKLKKQGINPTLVMLKLGDNEADNSYANNAEKRCDKVGIDVKRVNLFEDASKARVMDVIDNVNYNNALHALLMFRPLKDKSIEEEVSKTLDPLKDVDAMTESSLTSVFLGRNEGFAPCTAQSCIEILDFYGYDLTGKNVVVIGRSPVVGKPLAMLLQKRNATVTMCHTKTVGLAEIAKKADILLVAAGHPNTVTKDFVREGQVVIDVGINVVDGKLVGDVDFGAVEPIVEAITPVPGGVGAVTTSVLAKHIIEAAEFQALRGPKKKPSKGFFKDIFWV